MYMYSIGYTTVILLPLHPASLMHRNPKRHKIIYGMRMHKHCKRTMVDQMSHLCNLESITQLTSKEKLCSLAPK